MAHYLDLKTGIHSKYKGLGKDGGVENLVDAYEGQDTGDLTEVFKGGGTSIKLTKRTEVNRCRTFNFRVPSFFLHRPRYPVTSTHTHHS